MKKKMTLTGHPEERVHYSRADIALLKELPREDVYLVFGSFDDRGMCEDEFIMCAGELLDPRRVPGLADALKSPSPETALKAISERIRELGPPGEPPPATEETVKRARDVLENRFTFYQETYALGEEIDWDYNPGTARWGHDLNRFSYLDDLVGAFY